MIICPICMKSTGTYWVPGAELDTIAQFDYHLYQRTYVVEPRQDIITCHIMEKGEKPISPRCSQCYDKAVGTS